MWLGTASGSLGFPQAIKTLGGAVHVNQHIAHEAKNVTLTVSVGSGLVPCENLGDHDRESHSYALVARKKLSQRTPRNLG